MLSSLERWMTRAAAALVLLMLIVLVDVIGREVSRPLGAGTELTELAMATTVFLAFPLLAFRQRDFTADLFDFLVGGETLRKLQVVLAGIVGAAVYGLLSRQMMIFALPRPAHHGDARVRRHTGHPDPTEHHHGGVRGEHPDPHRQALRRGADPRCHCGAVLYRRSEVGDLAGPRHRAGRRRQHWSDKFDTLKGLWPASARQVRLSSLSCTRGSRSGRSAPLRDPVGGARGADEPHPVGHLPLLTVDLMRIVLLAAFPIITLWPPNQLL